jgi:predicted HicB family RNase H-like nuclease
MIIIPDMTAKTAKRQRGGAAEVVNIEGARKPKGKRSWRETYKKRMLNIRFPSLAAYRQIKRAAALEGDSLNSFVVGRATSAADEIIRRSKQEQTIAPPAATETEDLGPRKGGDPSGDDLQQST